MHQWQFRCWLCVRHYSGYPEGCGEGQRGLASLWLLGQDRYPRGQRTGRTPMQGTKHAPRLPEKHGGEFFKITAIRRCSHRLQLWAWMNLEAFMLSERSPSTKDKYYMTPVNRGPYRSQIHRDRKNGRVWAEGWGHCFGSLGEKALEMSHTR